MLGFLFSIRLIIVYRLIWRVYYYNYTSIKVYRYFTTRRPIFTITFLFVRVFKIILFLCYGLRWFIILNHGDKQWLGDHPCQNLFEIVFIIVIIVIVVMYTVHCVFRRTLYYPNKKIICNVSILHIIL